MESYHILYDIDKQNILSANYFFNYNTFKKKRTIFVMNTATNEKKISSEFYQCITSLVWVRSIFKGYNLSIQVYILLDITINFVD